MTPAPQDLSAFNTFGLASTAHAFVRIEDASQLPALAELARAYGRLLVLGGGSNVVLPARVDGLVAQVALRGIQVVASTPEAHIVEAAAGESWHDVVAYCVDRGMGGIENMSRIPGQAGAAPVQNIGAYGIELKDRFDSLRAFDLQSGKWETFDAARCAFAYRDSIFKREPGRRVIGSIRLRLPRPWTAVLNYPDLRQHPGLAEGNPTPRDIFNAVYEIRGRKLPDPAITGNAGSFFKNPVIDGDAHARLLQAYPGVVGYPQPDGRVKLAAGWLIDQCGWKGRRLGPAGVHDRQALVLVNHGGATAADIMALADAIRADVQAKFGVILEAEPVVVPGDAD